jgi:ABC-type multidrug transport system fused ATPase/permease subunit
LLGILGAPLDDAYMQKAFPNTGETEATKILEYMIKYWVFILFIAAAIYFAFQFLGKKFFGILSYNLTYDIRKLLYVNVLKKNIGFFDHAENATPVLTGVL